MSQSRRFSGTTISEVIEGVTIDPKGFTSRQADIVCFEPGRIPFLIIETKREGRIGSSQIQPLDQSVIGQALSYAYLYKIKFGAKPKAIMSANKSSFAVFVVPDDLEWFLDVAYVKRLITLLCG